MEFLIISGLVVAAILLRKRAKKKRNSVSPPSDDDVINSFIADYSIRVEGIELPPSTHNYTEAVTSSPENYTAPEITAATLEKISLLSR